jgi:hypothetical protein
MRSTGVALPRAGRRTSPADGIPAAAGRSAALRLADPLLQRYRRWRTMVFGRKEQPRPDDTAAARARRSPETSALLSKSQSTISTEVTVVPCPEVCLLAWTLEPVGGLQHRMAGCRRPRHAPYCVANSTVNCQRAAKNCLSIAATVTVRGWDQPRRGGVLHPIAFGRCLIRAGTPPARNVLARLRSPRGSWSQRCCRWAGRDRCQPYGS